MSTTSTHDLVVVVNTPDELFNAPPINPFTDNPVELLGTSGLDYITRQLQAHRQDRKNMRLRVRLPPDHVTHGLEERLRDAVRRYCGAKIEDNGIEIHKIRSHSSVGLGALLVVVAVIIGCAALLFAGPWAGASKAVQAVIASTISLFAWVSLWDPLEALLFDPIPLARENRALQRIMQMELVVEPEASSSAAAGVVATQQFNSSTSVAPNASS